jgi:uncharacterized protein YwqG
MSRPDTENRRVHVPELITGFNKPLGDPKAYPPTDSDEYIRRLLHETAANTIAFAHVFPPRHDEATSTFFGGLPFMPSGFEWPRSALKNVPLSFLGQVDCAALPGVGSRHFLPHEGVLCFFVDWDLFEGLHAANETTGYVQYASGPATSFREATPPADLPPLYGQNTSSCHSWLEHTDRTRRGYPKTSPRLAMRMDTLAIFNEEHPNEPDGNSAGRYKELWQEVQTAALHHVHGPTVERGGMFKAPDTMRHKAAVWRPFPTFPHAWLAVEMVCGELLNSLKSARQNLERGKEGTGEKWPRDPIAHGQIYDRVADEAAGWILAARDEGLMTGPSDQHKMAFWAWFNGLDAAIAAETTDWLYDARSNYTLNRCIAGTVSRPCDECVMFSAASAALVPPDVVNELRANHSPLVAGRGMTAGRHQMLGRGRDIQGAPERMGREHILLMQLDTDAGLSWMMGDCGALQYWIALEDLRVKRFDRVQATLEGY